MHIVHTAILIAKISPFQISNIIEKGAPVSCSIFMTGPLTQVLAAAIGILGQVHVSVVLAGTDDAVNAGSTADIQEAETRVLP